MRRKREEEGGIMCVRETNAFRVKKSFIYSCGMWNVK